MAGLIRLATFLCVNSIFMTKAINTLDELRSDTYYSALMPGKTSLLYFTNPAFPSNIIFLDELQKSAGALQDYGISVAKVNCMKEDLLKYCGEENAYLFRGAKLVREFPTDALFDVDSIVANVLFVLLYNEVKYITTSMEHQNIESAMKGKKDLIFAYVQAIGIPEHRSVMETAFVYGSKYQFILTTETKLLENISASLDSSRLFFSHCKGIKTHSQECPRTILEQPITTVNIHRFLKLMDAPLVMDISGDPEKVTSVHLQLGLPMVFILSQQETYEFDRTTAEHVAWQLLGKAGIGILLREKAHSSVPTNCNVAVKRPNEDSPVQYMTMEETQEIRNIIEKSNMEQYNKSEETSVFATQEIQDDEVAEAVYRDRKRTLPLHLVPSLTDENFKHVLTNPPMSMILYYASWEAVSLTLLQTFVHMAEKYKDTLDMILARVNCADWPNICSEQNVSNIPVVKIYQMGKEPLEYTGMLGAEELFRFSMLAKVDCPLELFSYEEAEQFLSGKLNQFLLPYHNLSVLGIFTKNTKEVDSYFNAGKSLWGFASLGIYYEDNAMIMHDTNQVHSATLQHTAERDIINTVRMELLREFPEITMENFPTFFMQKKPLLVLFSNCNPTQSDEKHILNLVRGRYLDQFLACWLNLKNTPVGVGILQRYFGIVPSLPQLVLIDFDSLGQVFSFPLDHHLTDVNILYWLEMIKAGAELPVYSLSNEDWKPPLPDYNFLDVMDAEVPGFAAQKIRIQMKPNRRQKVEDSPEGVEEESEAKQYPPGSSLRGTVPKFIEQGKKFRSHTEL
ncbi:thioredoxin domain-containing protein 16 isoform X2 [Xenopus tropicalis]|uniref:Thioredoxin domain-containing protein 16 isoform X2 n=1 Tax=Xenopus tropicalis TaxID=8364 RepID=A0A8J1ILQ2_XENTR|nr:thioredoxin domain-containing protein 16 isoform X2 [Xenopus tropicalis]